jgi:hypothetical protein
MGDVIEGGVNIVLSSKTEDITAYFPVQRAHHTNLVGSTRTIFFTPKKKDVPFLPVII